MTLQEQIKLFKEDEPLVFMDILKDVMTEDGLIEFDHDTALEEFNMWLNGLVPFTKSKKKIIVMLLIRIKTSQKKRQKSQK